MQRQLLIHPAIHGEPDKIMSQPVVVRVTKFDEEAAKLFAEEVEKANNTFQPVVPVVIDSFGGSIYSLMDMVAHVQSSPKPVMTVVEGKAMSCGAMLFLMGQERVMAPHATLMLHDGFTITLGKTEEVKADAAELDRICKVMFDLAAVNCGHPKGYLQKQIHDRSHAEWFITAKQAKRYKLATQIGYPKLVTTVGVAQEIVLQ